MGTDCVSDENVGQEMNVEEEGNNECLNCNHQEDGGVNCNQEVVEEEGSEDSGLNDNFKDLENDIGIDGEITIDEEEVNTNEKGK
ncbi:hypothetical protein RYX36_027910 [Vicia faba]